MKTQIEIKSVLCGVAVGVLAIMSIGAATSGQVGRYQITGITTGSGVGAAFVVDTQTGEVWAADIHNDWNPKADKFWEPK